MGSRMMGRRAQASIAIMRLWKPHDPGRLCLLHPIVHLPYQPDKLTERRSPASGTTAPRSRMSPSPPLLFAAGQGGSLSPHSRVVGACSAPSGAMRGDLRAIGALNYTLGSGEAKGRQS